MKKYFTSLPGLLMLTFVAIFASCSIFEADEIELTPIFDCPELELNFRDSCELTILGAPQAFFGVVSGDCACVLDTILITFDCPDLMANIGDGCLTADNLPGTVTADCACETEPVSGFDCPDLMANFRDSCLTPTPDSLRGFINQNCGCEAFTTSEFDCPALGADFQDACILADGSEGFVNEDCECAGTPAFDCPDLEANFNGIR